MAFVSQILVAIISIACFLLRYYFKVLSRNSSRAERKKFELISVFMIGATVIGLICFICLVVDQMMTTGQAGVAFFKIFVVGIIICEIINYKNDDLRDGMCQTLSIIASTLIALFCLVPGMFEWESNINRAETQKYSQEQFELVEVFEDTNMEVSVNLETSISKYFKYEVEDVKNAQNSEEEKEITEKKQTYEICYLDKTSLKPVPEGQKPYMIVKTYTSYSINNNVDPPEECDFKDSYEYELYVPKEDIEELSKLLK